MCFGIAVIALKVAKQWSGAKMAHFGRKMLNTWEALLIFFWKLKEKVVFLVGSMNTKEFGLIGFLSFLLLTKSHKKIVKQWLLDLLQHTGLNSIYFISVIPLWAAHADGGIWHVKFYLILGTPVDPYISINLDTYVHPKHHRDRRCMISYSRWSSRGHLSGIDRYLPRSRIRCRWHTSSCSLKVEEKNHAISVNVKHNIWWVIITKQSTIK